MSVNPGNSLQSRHNWHDCVSNHQPHDWLPNRLFRRRSNKTSKLCVTGLCVGKSPGPVISPHKWPVTRKMFPFYDIIMRFMWGAQTVKAGPYLSSTRIHEFISWFTINAILHLRLFDLRLREWWLSFIYIERKLYEANKKEMHPLTPNTTK